MTATATVNQQAEVQTMSAVEALGKTLTNQRARLKDLRAIRDGMDEKLTHKDGYGKSHPVYVESAEVAIPLRWANGCSHESPSFKIHWPNADQQSTFLISSLVDHQIRLCERAIEQAESTLRDHHKIDPASIKSS